MGNFRLNLIFLSYFLVKESGLCLPIGIIQSWTENTVGHFWHSRAFKENLDYETIFWIHTTWKERSSKTGR